MHNLLKAEFFKLKKSWVYKVAIFLYLIYEIWYYRNEVSNCILYTGISYTGIEWIYRMPTEVSYILFMWFFIPVIIAPDYSNRTYTGAFLCGYPRKKVFGAKTIISLIGMIPIMLIHFITGTVIWTMSYGFGAEADAHTIMIIIKTLLYCIFSLSVLGSTYILFSVLAKNTLGAIAMSSGITQLVGSILGNLTYFIENPVLRKPYEFIAGFSILTQLGELKGGDKIVHVPFLQTVISSVAVTFLMMFAAVYNFERQDVK